jgi:hypothetical protein
MGDRKKKAGFLLSPIIHHLSRLLSCCAVLTIACEEAGAAINRASLRRIEGHCRLLTALGALDGNFDSLPDAGCLRGGNGCEAFILGLLARFATLGLVLQTFVMKEDLLARRPDEIVSTVNTLNCAVFEFNFRMTPLPV